MITLALPPWLERHARSDGASERNRCNRPKCNDNTVRTSGLLHLPKPLLHLLARGCFRRHPSLWVPIASIGRKWIVLLNATMTLGTSSTLRLTIDGAVAPVQIAQFAAFKACATQ